MDLASTIGERATLTLVAGDLNDSPGAAAYRRVVEAGCRDAVLVAGAGFATSRIESPHRRIDFLFVRAAGDAAMDAVGRMDVLNAAPFLGTRRRIGDTWSWVGDHISVADNASATLKWDNDVTDREAGGSWSREAPRIRR